MNRRTLTKLLAGASTALAVMAGGIASAQDFPSETIRLIVPYSPGGGTDSIGRAFALALEEVSGQAVVVENISGSAGINGMLALAKSEPNGYTIALNGTSDVTAPIAFREQAPYEIGDFACAGAIFNTPVWVLAHSDNGYGSLDDFLEDARANPGERIMGITGKVSATDFVASTIKGTSGLDFKVVSFGGGGPLKKAIIANQVDAGVIISPVLLPEVKEGTLTALAGAGDMSGINHDASKSLGHIRDSGADIDVALVRGIWMPAGVDPAVQAKMESLVSEAIATDTFKSFASNFGFAPYSESGADFCGRLDQEVTDLQTVLSRYLEK
ncbi:tripartite tricarboxylate transporter substrate binding protein [Cognatishimia sp. SS12]|uniref:Bug family tripartite tricarboxylate transporter substrate binding protein n=1 Tax=Cognatishimia sp. SS12 TaxID=2979465 RepID=UPI00232B15F1|nr:tripartite tricarboxylate transporter substrate binding protein [Cognatishimia sp. SS12]MDC0738298.1 tripartite tricarboxylate transporter substrate binding protein [Cognatishimia sp. SS12]